MVYHFRHRRLPPFFRQKIDARQLLTKGADMEVAHDLVQPPAWRKCHAAAGCGPTAAAGCRIPRSLRLIDWDEIALPPC